MKQLFKISSWGYGDKNNCVLLTAIDPITAIQKFCALSHNGLAILRIQDNPVNDGNTFFEMQNGYQFIVSLFEWN